MKWIQKKLNSKSGISLAIALVFFLLCAMVGTVVLSAASVSAGNTARERQLYRETLAMTSAANALSRDIQSMTFTGAYQRIETVTTTSPANASEKTKVETELTYQTIQDDSAPRLENSDLFQIKKEGGVVNDDLNLWAIYLDNQADLKDPDIITPPVTPEEKHFSFGAVEDQSIPEVRGTVTVANDYTITVVLMSGDNSLTMNFSPNAAVKTENTVTNEKNGNLVSVKKTVTTYTTTLTWDQPMMREGGVIHEETT